MAVETGLTRDLGAALSIDFAEKFGKNIKSLYDLLGAHSLIPMAAGTVIKTYTSSVTLDDNVISPGDIIPLSEVVMKDGPTIELVFNKKRKSVPIEDIQKYGFNKAITMTDEKLIRAIQKQIRDNLLGQLATGTGEAEGENLQKLMAQNWAAVTAKFSEDDVEVVSFANPFDVADYLGEANVSLQTTFGMNYLENFLGNKIVFLHADVPAGTVYSTAIDNLNLAYASINGEMSKAFDLTSDESGIIGVTHDTQKQRLTSETIAISAIAWFAERVDGVIVGEIEPVTP